MTQTTHGQTALHITPIGLARTHSNVPYRWERRAQLGALKQAVGLEILVDTFGDNVAETVFALLLRIWLELVDALL